MKAIQIVIDEELLSAADRSARKDRVSRSELMRQALREYLAKKRTRDLEEQHRRGYERHPVVPGEFDAWDRVQAWPED